MRKILFVICLLCVSLFSKNLTLNLEDAIALALKNNGLNKISKLNLQIANVQYQQALSSNYPSIDTIIYASRDRRDTIFQQRGAIALSPDSIKQLASLTPSLMGDLSTANAINSLPNSMIPSSSLDIELDTKAKGRDTVLGRLELNYPIYTGGKISAIIEQARLNKGIKEQSIIRDESGIVFDVKKYYYGYVLTSELYSLIDSIYENMKFSRDLTKEFLEHGTDLKIKRTDYLNIKLLTTLIESTLSKIELNQKMLEGAIANLIGLKYNDVIKIKYNKQKILKSNTSLVNLIKNAHNFNPGINSINLALKIKDEQIKEKDAEYYPMVNLFGNVSHTYNSYDYGYVNKDNENSWTIGVAIKMSLFNGYKTKNEVLEKRLDRRIVEEQKVLLEEGLALMLKNEFLKSSIGYKQVQTLKEAVKTATENSKMNFKGYQYEMVEAKDLVQSQLMEVYVKADYLKNVHDYLVSLAMIDKLIGSKVYEKF